MYYHPHVVQAGMSPYPGAPTGYPSAQTVVPDSLSVSVAAVKNTADAVAALKHEAANNAAAAAAAAVAAGQAAAQQTVSSLAQQTGGQFSPPVLNSQNIVSTTASSVLPLPLPVSGISNGIEQQQTGNLTELLQQQQQPQQSQQQNESETGQIQQQSPQAQIQMQQQQQQTKTDGQSSGVTTSVTGGVIGGLTSTGNVTTAPTTGAITLTPTTSCATIIGQQQQQTVNAASSETKNQPKRLHVSNIPFRFRDPDLRAMFGTFGTILDVEIIFNERGSKGFGFVTFANCSDAERARERLHGTVVEGRKIEVNNATARVQTKKPTVTPSVCVQWPEAAAAIRGVAIQRGRSRAAFPAAAAAAAFARLPSPLAAAGAANALHGYAPVYYDPFLAAAAAAQDPNYRMQAAKPVAEVPAQPTILNATAPLLKTPLSQAQQAYNAATYTAVAARAAYGAAAAAAQPTVAGYATVAGYGREYAADPYLGHGVGPVPGYGAAVYRGGYNRFTPY